MNTFQGKRIVATVTIVIVAFLAYSTLMDGALNSIPVVRTMNEESARYLDDWTKKSIATFVVTKGINAGLSVIQDSELQVTLFGSGVTLAAGEVVRPLNDMVARVASVSMASAVSLGIQKFLLDIGGLLGLKWLLTLSMICWLVAIWAEAFTRIDFRRLAYGILMAALLFRFFVPMTVLATGYIGDQYMESAYTEAQQKLEMLDTEARKVDVLESSGDGSKDSGIFGGFKKALGGARQRASDLGARFVTMSDAYIDVAIDTIVVFVVQTMLMPVLILWGMVKLLGFLLGSSATAAVEARLFSFARRTDRRRVANDEGIGNFEDPQV